MRLTRRDAVLALMTMGIVVGGGTREFTRDDGDLEEVVDGMVAIAEVIYPSAVTDTREFVETWVRGRMGNDEYTIENLIPLLRAVDREARTATGSRFVDLDLERRDEVLRGTGAAAVFPDPEGTVPQRIRYYLINDLLYALYTSPTGGEITGNENPDGHPGGLEAYQRGPDDE